MAETNSEDRVKAVRSPSNAEDFVLRISEIGLNPKSAWDRATLSGAVTKTLVPEMRLVVEEELCGAYRALAIALGHSPRTSELDKAYEQQINAALKEDKEFVGPLPKMDLPPVERCYSWETYKQYFGSIGELRRRSGVPSDSRTKYTGPDPKVEETKVNLQPIRTAATADLAAEPKTMVIKYFDLIDEFVKIRVANGDNSDFIVAAGGTFSNKEQYRSSIVRALVPNLDEVFEKVRETDDGYETEIVEELLYQIIIDVNPSLEIHQVTFGKDAKSEGQRSSGGRMVEASPLVDVRLAAQFESAVRENIIGQDQALDVICKHQHDVCGLRNPNRPVANYLFIGPSGVGKTEVAKILADTYAGRDNFLRIDCGEYALPHEYAKLIGSPPGYIGHNEGGMLTEWKSKRKYAVILFDEIEKAHIKVHHLLLGLLDNGIVTDSKGKQVDFRNAIIVCTSNIGLKDVEAVRNRMGFGSKSTDQQQLTIAESFVTVARSGFSTEWVNRFDELVPFRYLDLDDAKKITGLKLRECEQLGKQQGRNITIHPHFTDWLLRQRYDDPKEGSKAVFSEDAGARYVQRAAIKEISQLVSGTIRAKRLNPDRLHDYQFTIAIHDDSPIVRVTDSSRKQEKASAEGV